MWWCALVWAGLALADPLDLEDGASEPTEADAFRSRVEAFGRLPPDEEIEAWEAWLDETPDSPFRDLALARIDTLTLDAPPAPPPVKPALRLAQGVLMEDFDPRSGVKFGFQIGLPEYLDLMADYEHALRSTWSVHGGVRRRITGWSVEGGSRWALVKTRTTLVSILGDVRVNTAPAFGAIRPQLGVGQRLGRLDLALVGGADVELREGGGATWLGAGNATVRVTDAARVFLEGSWLLKHPTWPGGAFRYDTVTLGIELLFGKTESDRVAAHIGATVPSFYRWWLPNQGSAMVRLDGELD